MGQGADGGRTPEQRAGLPGSQALQVQRAEDQEGPKSTWKGLPGIVGNQERWTGLDRQGEQRCWRQLGWRPGLQGP